MLSPVRFGATFIYNMKQLSPEQRKSLKDDISWQFGFVGKLADDFLYTNSHLEPEASSAKYRGVHQALLKKYNLPSVETKRLDEYSIGFLNDVFSKAIWTYHTKALKSQDAFLKLVKQKWLENRLFDYDVKRRLEKNGLLGAGIKPWLRSEAVSTAFEILRDKVDEKWTRNRHWETAMAPDAVEFYNLIVRKFNQ